MSRGGQNTILIVEDDISMRTSLVTRMKAEGYRVLAVGSAKEALAMLRKESVNLLLLDLLLDDTSGMAMLHQAKGDSEIDITSFQVVILTGLDDPSALATVLEEGMYDYLVKGSVSLDDVAAHVKSKLNSK